MAKATKTKAVKKAAKPTVAAPKIVRAVAKPTADAATAAYEVLTPFKYRDATVKPPAWIEMTEAEAAEYQDADVLGTEPGEMPGKGSQQTQVEPGAGDTPPPQ